MFSTVLWVVSFALDIVFLLWIVRWGGAEWLREHWLADLLICFGASNLDEDVIKFLAWTLFIISAIWFAVGVFDPRMRVDLPDMKVFK